MADGKRLSTAGRVATPKIGGQAMGELDTALAKAVGARIRVTTSLSDLTVEGVLFTVCSLTNIIAVNTAPAPPNPSSPLSSQPGDYHIVPVSHIQSFQILSLPNESGRGEGSSIGFDGALPSISRLDVGALKKREEDAIRKIKERDATRGRGVGKEAQEIFDHISRLLPTRWHDANIIVNDAVIISPPYGLENCAAAKDKGHSLARVHKFLEGFYDRKKSQGGPTTTSAGRPVVATPIAPRKGG